MAEMSGRDVFITSLWVKACESIHKPKFPNFLSLADIFSRGNKRALQLMLAFGRGEGRRGAQGEWCMYFLPAYATVMCVRLSYCLRKNPANLELTGVILKRKVHDAWTENIKKKYRKKRTNQHYSIQLKLPALKEEKHPRHTISKNLIQTK